MLSHCRVVLVRPEVPANVGATARVMRNMGLTDLVLVAPVADINDRQARQLSTHGEEVLDRCRIVPDLADALTDCVMVAATSSHAGGQVRRQQTGTPEDIVPHLLAHLDPGPVALVFGPEPSGLTNAEVVRAHYLIQIPADESYPALNLAQAVAVCLYELRRQWLKATQPPEPRPVPAPFAEQERMFVALREALEGVHFLYDERADAQMHALRHLIGRAGPSSMEVKLLQGLARQLRWAASNLTPPSPPSLGGKGGGRPAGSNP